MSADHTLKHLETQYSKAARAELDRDLDRAFRLYIQVAQDFLHLSRTSNSTAIRAECKTHAGKALERAEKIKQVKRDVAPVIADRFSEQEQFAVLRHSSNVNGTRIPLWSEPIVPSTGITQPPLSPEQVQNNAKWRRPEHIHDNNSKLESKDVIQHMVSDCSVCASVAICIEHDRRFGSKLGSSSLLQFPDEPDRYHLKAMFNGTYRRVEIDNQLPCYPDGTLMCLSTGPKSVLWPSLVEKAYMKLVGGYDFPGSNSSTDLHVLTGWIPEHIEVKGAYFERESTWDRINTGFTEGRCVLTVGTGERLPELGVFPMELLPAHCYAVIDVRDDEQGRRMTILDSRVHHTSSEDVEQDFTRLSLLDSPVERPRSYDLSWDIICNVFDGIYLSWDSGTFEHKLAYHGKWKREEAGDQPQIFRATFRVETSSLEEEEIWVLLTRHITDSRRKSEYVSLTVQDTTSSDLNSLHLKGSYTNSTHILVKARCSSLSPELLVVASYDGDYDDVGFTVTIYSSTSASWVRDAISLPYVKKIAGAFTNKTAGGNPTHPTFMLNPQYHLRIRSGKTRLKITARSDRHVPLNIVVAWSNGERIAELTQNAVVASSGSYSYGFAFVSKDLSAGDYTLIVSSFNPQSLGPFTVDISGTQPFEIDPIPQEGAGMFSKVIRGSWTSETAAGSPSFNRYVNNPIYEMKLSSQSHVKIRLQLVDGNAEVPINVTVFRLTEHGTLGSQVATSGPYADAISGVVTPQFLLQHGLYAVVPSTYTPGILASFRLLVYTTAAGATVDSRHISA